MNRHVKTWCLPAFYCLAVLLAGCFPDDSLQWTGDGSWGLFRAEGKLFLVEGASGELTPVEEEGGAGIMPGISVDGSHIAYTKGIGCPDVTEGLRLFPPATTAMIRRDAEQLAQKVVAGLVPPESLLPGENKALEFAEPYHRWVLRTMCENPEVALAAKLGPDVLEECRQCRIGYNRLIVASRSNPREGRTLVTLPVMVFPCRFSPDGRYIAYVMPDRREEMGTLLVASIDGETSGLEISKGVAVSYDWRPDSRALVYLKRDGDALLGVVEEKIVVDEVGDLLAELASDPSTAPVGVYRCSGASRQLAGTLFQPLMKVQYGSEGRLFFSSPAAKIPTSSLEEPTYSLFCYDLVTGTVVDVLPATVSATVGESINFFSLSPDGTRVLLPMEKNRFAIYALGTKTPVTPVAESEAFGEGPPDMLPAWRGNTQITCLVSGNSRLLGDSAEGREDRNEIVVLNVEGDFHSHLSADWPDEIMP